MTDTAVTTTDETAPPPDTDGMLLDGDAPRLGSTPIIAPVPMGSATAPPAHDAVAQPTENRYATEAPEVPAADLPTLPTAEPAAPITTEDDETATTLDEDAEPAHPMAHLMPPRSKPTEASIKAAEQRSVKKAKAKKIKIAVVAGALLVAALAGPPLVSWLTNAVNESGGLNTEEPAD